MRTTARRAYERLNFYLVVTRTPYVREAYNAVIWDEQRRSTLEMHVQPIV